MPVARYSDCWQETSQIEDKNLPQEDHDIASEEHCIDL
jgi:hypothetical protein